MKWLSGDFVSQYNKLMTQLKEEQTALDDKFTNDFNNLVELETSRLEQTVPYEFEIGQKVVNSFGQVGKVVSSHIDLHINTDQLTDLDQPVVGPNRYHQLENGADEDVITCEGMLRLYMVEFPSTQLEMDWGKNENIVEMYPDEMTPDD
tara:strand:+ start:234 stop:680 length:447 start_codon:yes stop_codon:yes gene_type:complete